MHLASRDQALDATRAFHASHGRLPRWREWERAAASRPCAKSIERRWGWRELLDEAIGVQPNDIDVGWEGVLDDRGAGGRRAGRLSQVRLVDEALQARVGATTNRDS